MLHQKIFLLLVIGSLGCGQTTSNGDAGPDGESLDVITSGCFNGHSDSVAYDASACVPQLESTFSCNGSICSWNVIIPCADNDAGDAGDAGVDCNTICKDVQPSAPHFVSGFCQKPITNDAGVTGITCGGCGV